jgi:hypothetical protein
MTDSSWTPDVNWSTWEQTRGEVEYSVKHKISSEISAYAEHCRAKGLSTYFVSGLEVAANIALNGSQPKPNQDEETLF